MKAIPAAIVSVILLVILITPVFAAGPVVVQGNGGAGPSMILGIWVQDLSGALEDGDMIHGVDGAQFLPPCVAGMSKTVQVYALVTDEQDGSVLKEVKADVQKSGCIYHDSITLIRTSLSEGIWSAEHGGIANIIRYAEGVSKEDIMTNLRAGTVSVWKGEVNLPSSQNAGLFTVTVTGIDTREQSSASLKNSFTYLPVACIEYDFSSIDYGDVGVGSEKWVFGDEIFGTGDKPTVRNTGNVPARIRLIQDDMGFGQDVQSGWNVRYKARMGTTESIPHFSPGDEVLIPERVNQGKNQSMDFLIQVVRGSGSHTGTMTLGYDALSPDPSGDPVDNQIPVPEFPGLKEFLELLVHHFKLD